MEEALRGADLRGEDQKAVFARVWKRVMEDRTEASPITWEEPQGQSPMEGTQEEEAQRAETGEATVLPARAAHGPRGDFPQEEGGVLGPNCLDCAPLLQELLRRELADCREYQILARRAGGGPARVLAGLAGEKKRRAKRLSAAYFLISGVRYWPENEKCPPVTSYLGTLRRRFAQEQATMAAYLAGTEGTTDPCLRQLFLELAEESWDQACKIRLLVEQA